MSVYHVSLCLSTVCLSVCLPIYPSYKKCLGKAIRFNQETMVVPTRQLGK